MYSVALSSINLYKIAHFTSELEWLACRLGLGLGAQYKYDTS